MIKRNGIQKKQHISSLCVCWKKYYYFQSSGIMVGHMPDLITSVIASVKAREYISLPSKWIIGWDMTLQGKKVLTVLIPSSLNVGLKIHFPQAKLELQDYGKLEFMHTNELPNRALCSQCERIWERSIRSLYRCAGSENGGADGLSWDYCSSCNANTT